jgi:hypothetical protein
MDELRVPHLTLHRPLTRREAERSSRRTLTAACSSAAATAAGSCLDIKSVGHASCGPGHREATSRLGALRSKQSPGGEPGTGRGSARAVKVPPPQGPSVCRVAPRGSPPRQAQSPPPGGRGCACYAGER